MNIREVITAVTGTALGIPILIGAPITFFYLIIEDAQRSHSFLKWILLINLDAAAAATWPIYWISRIFGFSNILILCAIAIISLMLYSIISKG
jgi:uncharacterized membrane protein